MLRPILIPSACLALLFVAGCKPCGCAKASLALIGEKEPDFSLSIEFDDSFLPFVDDKFKITVIKKDKTVQTLSGTYKETSDTIRFKTEGNLDFLSLKSGEINKLECNKPREGQFTVTAPAQPPLTLTFACTER